MSDTVYQIVGECAYVTTNSYTGPTRVLALKGALVSADAPELQHLLDTGLVKQVGGEETGGVNADGEPTIVAEERRQAEEQTRRQAERRQTDRTAESGEDDKPAEPAGDVQARQPATRAKTTR